MHDIPKAGINVEDNSNLETAHKKRKLKLAEHWMEIRDSVYSTMNSAYTL